MHKLNGEKFFFFSDEYFEKDIHSGSLEHAYLAILSDDLNSAERIFRALNSPRACWGSILVSILKGYLEIFPTFFQIRNFLEIDLDFLIKNNKISYIEQLLGATEILSEINQETYKFIARVMYENKFYSSALKYLEKSKKIHYKDPELHFMFARYFLRVNDYVEALFYINECLSILPDYFPAQVLKLKIEEKLY